MSFNYLLILIFICSCGVKSRPIPPANKKIPDYIQSHLDNEESKKQATKKLKP